MADEQDDLVAVALRGRLGNHLFQFALVKALRPDQPVIVDDLRRSAASLRHALVDGAVRIITTQEALRLHRPPRMRRGRLRLADLIERLGGDVAGGWLHAREYAETTEGVVDRGVFTVHAPVLITGYFQNEGYFVQAADVIAASFRPPGAEFHETLDEFHRSVGFGPTVAVVVRAGLDYEDLGWMQHFEWYRRAAARITDVIGAPRFAVFSDIPVAAEATAAALGDLGPAMALTRLDPITQLHLIAAMDHAVVSASSFSWWGAWLGDHRSGFDEGRVVIAPDPWIRPALDGTPPTRWTREVQ